MNELVTVAAFALNLVVTIIVGTWRLSRMQVELIEKINAARSEVEDRQDSFVEQIRETFAALRQKVADVELYASNNYMRSDGFYIAKREITDEIKSVGITIDKRLGRLEARLFRLDGKEEGGK